MAKPTQATRSKFATDVMHRLWDTVRSSWVSWQGKSIWTSTTTPNTLRDRMVKEGRNPDTLEVCRVFVEVK